jgi:WD40 repeat protein
VTLPPTAPTPEDAAEWPTVPGYEIMGELGRGGMGVVYWAWQPELNRTVALKMVLAGAHAGPQELARFRTEAEAVGRLQHPHIVQIYGVGRHEDHPYLVLEYVDGGNLAQQLTGTPFPARRAAELVETLARAVDHAHQRGIVHRDLTPGNVLLAADGQPKITDFGLAKLLVGGGAVRTQSGAIVGTPSYMAPEQAAGKTGEVGPATDVYGLGAILYELLTGRPPFRAETPLETLLQVQADEPVPPSRLQPKLPPDLGTICLKAIAKAPERRYPSAGDLADDLHRWLSGEPIRARPVSARERVWAWAKRRPAVAALLLVSGGATLMLVGGAVGLWYHGRLQEEFGKTQEALETARRAQKQAAIFQYFHHIAVAHAEWREGNVGRMEPLLEDSPPEHRNWEWHYLKRLCHPELLTLPGHTGQAWGLAVSPDGNYFASGGDDCTVKIWDAATGQLIHTLTGHRHSIPEAAFSPNGKLLASAGWDKTVRVWDVATGQPIRTLEGHSSGVWNPVFSSDGTRLASVGMEGTVIFWDLGTGQAIRRLPSPTPNVKFYGVAFSPDGTRFASPGSDSIVWVREAATGRVEHQLKQHTGVVWRAAFSPDGRRLASASEDKTVRVWDATTGRLIHPLKGHTGPVRSVVFSPDGALLASAGGQAGDEVIGGPGGEVSIWDAATGQSIRTLPQGQSEHVCNLAFSPDGKRLASVGGSKTIKVWEVSTGQELLALDEDVGPVSTVAFSPNGAWLVSAGWHGAVRIWDATTGRPIRTLTGHTSHVWSLAFSPDSTRLASASRDGSVKVWDLGTYQEAISLRGYTGDSGDVVFSPDGTRLVSAGKDGTLRVWDARPWGAEAPAEREALGLLDLLFAKPLRKADVREYLRTSPTIRPEVRDMALALMERYREEPDWKRYHGAARHVVRQPYLNRRFPRGLTR